jgi:hypothetical protein
MRASCEVSWTATQRAKHKREMFAQIEKCTTRAAEIVAHYTSSGDKIHALPWTLDGGAAGIGRQPPGCGADLGLTALAGSPADFANLIAEETEKWGKVIRATNIKPD